MPIEFTDEKKSLELAKYFEGLNLLGIQDDYHPSDVLLGFYQNVTANALVTENNQLGHDHINRAIETYAQGQDIAVTEVKISGSEIDCHGIYETITGKMTNPDIKSASHVIEMGGHWMALTFKQQTDESGKPKITAFLADSLPETPAGDIETSFDKNRKLLQKYLKGFRVDFQRVKVDTQGTEQCGENAVANVLAMQKASYQDLQKHQYDLSQSSLSTQAGIQNLHVEIPPARIREELKVAFNNIAKTELENQIRQDMVQSQPLTQQFSPAVGVAGSPSPMEVGGDGLIGGLRFEEPTLLSSLRRKSPPIREDYPLLGYLEQFQTNLAFKKSLNDVAGQPTTELEKLNLQRQELLSNLSETLKNHIDPNSVLEGEKRANQFLNNLESLTVANNLEKFLPLIEDVVRDPRKINNQETQLKMQLTIHRIKNPSALRSQLSSHEKLSLALSESHEKLQQNFNLYKNFTLDQGLDGKYAFPEKRLSRIKNELINYLQIDKQSNSGGNPSLDQQTKELINAVFEHEPSNADEKLPFILQLVEQPQFVYDQDFRREYFATVTQGVGQSSTNGQFENPILSRSDEAKSQASGDHWLRGRKSDLGDQTISKVQSSYSVTFEGKGFGSESPNLDGPVAREPAGKKLSEDVYSVVNSLQRGDIATPSATPSSSPMPVSCFSFKGLYEMAKRMFGGVKSEVERGGGAQRSRGSSQVFGRRLFGEQKRSGQSR